MTINDDLVKQKTSKYYKDDTSNSIKRIRRSKDPIFQSRDSTETTIPT